MQGGGEALPRCLHQDALQSPSPWRRRPRVSTSAALCFLLPSSAKRTRPRCQSQPNLRRRRSLVRGPLMWVPRSVIGTSVRISASGRFVRRQ